MVSNIWFDICAVSLILVILYTHSLKKNLKLKQNIIFILLLVSVTGTTMSGLCSTIIENSIAEGVYNVFEKTWILMTLSLLYFFFHISTPLLYVMYIYSLLNITNSRLSDYLKLYVPYVLSLIVLTLTPFTNGVFYYDELNIYHRGKMIAVFYGAALYYVIFGIFLLVRYRRSIRRDNSAALGSFALFAFAGTFIQYFWPVLRVENFFNSLVLLMLYISIERPADIIDSRTGLVNANAFYLSAGISFQRGKKINFVLVMIDHIDEMEKELGAACINMLMIEVARFLGRFSKQADIYRLDEGIFAVEVNSRGEKAAENIMGFISQRFSQPFSSENYNIVLTECSCYISCPKDAGDTESLKRIIKLASDSTLHRNRHMINAYDIDVEGDNRNRAITKLLKDVTARKLIEIRYQPVFSVSEQKFVAAETQVFIDSPDAGRISAREFLPIAEKNGYVSELSEQVMDSICTFIEKRHPEEYGIMTFEVTLPVSDLMRKDFVERVDGVLAAHAVPARMISFELTEDTIITYQGIIADNIETLHDRGYRFILDNYGNGYTNAGMIIKMPLDLVTLDRKLTHAALDSQRADTLLKSTVNMLEKLNLSVKAEMIENELQKEYAVALGCDFLQGYYISSSFHESEFEEFMKGGEHAAL